MKTKSGATANKIKVPNQLLTVVTTALLGLGMSACKAGPISTGTTVVSDAIAGADESAAKKDHGDDKDKDKDKDRDDEKDEHGCDGHDDDDDNNDQTDASSSSSDENAPAPEASPTPSPTATVTSDSCSTQSFTQPKEQGTNKLDLLFVTDTSGSLDTERAEIADQIDAFVAALPNTVEYQIAVMMAHGSRSDHSGRLWKYRSEPTVLNSETQTLSEIRSGLRDKLTNAKTDRHSDGGEEGLYSLHRGFDNGPFDSSKAKGFFRNDAALAVVFISDENDICAEYPKIVERVADPDGLEAPAYTRDCVNPAIKAETVLARLRNQQGDRPLLVAGVIYNNLDTVPRGGENEFGYGYSDIILQANGISVDMASADIAGGLRAIGELATVKLNLVTELTLDRSDFDLSTLAVTVDGVSSEFRYEPTTNQVQFLDPGHAGSAVSVSYCSVTPTPEPTPTAEPTPEPT
ncbi:MAG: hypothetical protein AAB425_13790, partial [Bdellovibrionota bacterium]